MSSKGRQPLGCLFPVLFGLLLHAACCRCRLFLWPGSEEGDRGAIQHSPQPGALPGWGGDTFSSKKVFTPDRGINNVQVISWKPRAFLFKNFITKAEADHLVALASPHMGVSEVVDDETGEVKRIKERSSTSFFLNRTQDAIVRAMEERIARATYLAVENQEPFEVLHYQNSQENFFHYDYFKDSNSKANGGQRVATVLLYLSDVEEGGETAFFAPGSTWHDKACTSSASSFVKPRKGNMLLFWNAAPDGTEDESSLHGSCPVIRGNKWTATKWIRASKTDVASTPVSAY